MPLLFAFSASSNPSQFEKKEREKREGSILRPEGGGDEGGEERGERVKLGNNIF